MSNSDCRRVYGDGINGRKICAGGIDGENVCNGDSGKWQFCRRFYCLLYFIAIVCVFKEDS